MLPTYDQLPRDVDGMPTAWGLFGDDDSIGRLNLIDAECVRHAMSCVRHGVSFGLNAPLDEFQPPLDTTRAAVVHRVLRGGEQGVEDLDDVLDSFFPQISSQWDSLAHIAARPDTFYNGRSLEDVTVHRRNTIDNWAARGVVTRGVLLDLPRSRGDRGQPSRDTSRGSVAVTVEELESARQRSGVEYSPGCAIVIRTGFLAWYRSLDGPGRHDLAQNLSAPGVEHSEAMARYLWDSGAAAIVSDSFATEVWPPDFSRTAFPYGFLHRVLIGRLGFAIGELWDLESLADDVERRGDYEFLLVSAPLHVRGGVGSPSNALAIT
jgi:kynurenine formamidase